MKKILVIDDMEYIRKNIVRVLRNRGYDVLEAANGIEGGELIRNEQIDLLITDIVMPKRSGVEVLMDLKQSLQNAKIIIITGKVSPTSDSFQHLVKGLGASEILYKPFKKQTLIETVEKLLAKRI